MEAKEYRIYIHNVVEQDKKETPEQQAASQPTPEKAKEVANKAEKSTALLIAQQVGKEAFGFALQNYGDLTGDYVTQQMLQVGLGLASDIVGVVIAGISGGVPGVAISATTIVLKYGLQGASYGLNIAKEQQRVSILQERLRVVSVGGERR